MGAEAEAEIETVGSGVADDPVAITGAGTRRGVAKRRYRKADFLIDVAEVHAKVVSVPRNRALHFD